MALLTITPINKTGVDMSVSLVAADVAGDTVSAAAGLVYLVKNGDASPHTVTITPPSSSANCPPYGVVDIDPITHVIAASEEVSFTIPTGYSSNGIITLDYDAVTSVTVGVFSVV